MHSLMQERSGLTNHLITEERETKLVENWKKTVDFVFLDFVKAYDAVEHWIPFSKLPSFGINIATSD